jgi:hypothetical protein
VFAMPATRPCVHRRAPIALVLWWAAHPERLSDAHSQRGYDLLDRGTVLPVPLGGLRRDRDLHGGRLGVAKSVPLPRLTILRAALSCALPRSILGRTGADSAVVTGPTSAKRQVQLSTQAPRVSAHHPQTQ